MLHYLKHTPNTQTNIYHITIEGDTNDGDYVNTTTYYTPEEFTQYLTLLLHIEEGRLDGTGEHSDRNSIKLTSEEEDLLYDIAPSSEYGVHSLTITYIQYFDISGKHYDVDLDTNEIRKTFPELFI